MDIFTVFKKPIDTPVITHLIQSIYKLYLLIATSISTSSPASYSVCTATDYTAPAPLYGTYNLYITV